MPRQRPAVRSDTLERQHGIAVEFAGRDLDPVGPATYLRPPPALEVASAQLLSCSLAATGGLPGGPLPLRWIEDTSLWLEGANERDEDIVGRRIVDIFNGHGECRRGGELVLMLNKGTDGKRMGFSPSYLHVEVGDSVMFIPVDRGHNAESILDMIPADAKHWKGKIDEEFTVTLTVPGLYAFVSPGRRRPFESERIDGSPTAGKIPRPDDGAVGQDFATQVATAADNLTYGAVRRT